MSNFVAKTQPNGLNVISDYTPEQVQLITRTVAKGASPDELQLFLYRCSLLKLNPLKPGQIHFIKYGNNPGTVVVGIEGFRSNSGRTGKHVSTTRGVTKDKDGNLTHGWCRVKRRDGAGEIQEYYEEVPFSEFNNERNPSWAKMPETMIKKVAEAACLRMAYPDELGGIYIEEEEHKIIEGQTSNGGIHPEQPNADDGDPNAVHEYRPGFGQWSAYTMREIANLFPRSKIEAYLTKLESYMDPKNPKFVENHEKMKVFIKNMSMYLAEQENGNQDVI